MWDLVGNPEDRFSHNEAHLAMRLIQFQMMKLFTRFPVCFVLVMGMLTIGEPHSEAKLSDAQPGAELYASAVYEMNADDFGRETRAITGTAKGLAAAQKLLAGAEKVKTTSKNYRSYMKAGNYETALADFNSVTAVVKKANPVGLFSYLGPRSNPYGPTLLGRVGDRRLILKQSGDLYSRGSPVLEIRSASDAMYDRIVYKTIKN